MANSGIFDVNDIRHLMDNQQWKNIGDLELIQTQTVTNQNAVDFTDIKENEYDVHFLTWTNVGDWSGTGSLKFRYFVDGTVITSSNYDYGSVENKADGNTYTPQASSATSFYAPMMASSGSDLTHGYIYFFGLGDAFKYSLHTIHTVDRDGNILVFTNGGGAYLEKNVVDGIRFVESQAANHFDGVFSLYGIRNP